MQTHSRSARSHLLPEDIDGAVQAAAKNWSLLKQWAVRGAGRYPPCLPSAPGMSFSASEAFCKLLWQGEAGLNDLQRSLSILTSPWLWVILGDSGPQGWCNTGIMRKTGSRTDKMPGEAKVHLRFQTSSFHHLQGATAAGKRNESSFLHEAMDEALAKYCVVQTGLPFFRWLLKMKIPSTSLLLQMSCRLMKCSYGLATFLLFGKFQ